MEALEDHTLPARDVSIFAKKKSGIGHANLNVKGDTDKWQK